MTNRRRIITAAAAIIATAAAALPPAMQVHSSLTRPAHPTPAHHTCTAEIIAFEDGSWLGGALRYDGRVIDPRWDDRMPTYGWRPGYRGTPCTLVIKP